jgi:hypothetical protein
MQNGIERVVLPTAGVAGVTMLGLVMDTVSSGSEAGVTPLPQRLAALPHFGFLSLSSGLGDVGLGVGVEGFSCKYLLKTI